MKAYAAIFCALSISLSAGLAMAQQRCEHAFLGDAETSLSNSLYKAIGNEFNLLLNNYNRNLLDRLVNKADEPTAQDMADFKQLLLELHIHDRKLTGKAENILDRTLTGEQTVALRLARALGRTESGRNSELFGFADNYTEHQIARKDRILELAGFSLEERVTLNSSKLLEDVLTKYAAENLILDNVSETPAQALAMNAKVIEQMNVLARSQNTNSTRLQVLNKKQIRSLYEAVTRHPVARLLNIRKYDPEGNIGFCFGRALTAHVEATQMGVDQSSIRKVFAVGHMKALVGDIIWQFHVGTAIKNDSGGWTVIDPFIGKPISLEAWYEKMYKQDTKGTLRIYITDPMRLGATGSERYNKAGLMSDFYNDYFKKIAQYYRLKSAGKLPEKPLWVKTMDLILSILNIGI